MVELDKLVQRSEALKRLRSLFDMHRVAFGSSGNLADVLTALHHDRHFAMDFWGVVGGLCASEGAPLSEEEMFSAVVESATGMEPSALDKQELKAATELRRLLAGIDIGVPAAIERPADELLNSPRYSPQRESAATESTAADSSFDDMRFEAPPHETPGTGIPLAHRSIGETLARLEETSRELREQLAGIEGSQPEAAAAFAAVHALAVETVQAAEASAEFKPSVEEQGESFAEPKAAHLVQPERDEPENMSLSLAGMPQIEEANAAAADESTPASVQAVEPGEATAAEETPVSASPEEPGLDSRLEPLPVVSATNVSAGTQPGRQDNDTPHTLRDKTVRDGASTRPATDGSTARPPVSPAGSGQRQPAESGARATAQGSGTRQSSNTWRPPQPGRPAADTGAFTRRAPGRGGRSLASPRYDEEDAAAMRERIRRVMGGDMSGVDDPRIPTPLASYGETEERSPARFAIVGLAIVAISGGIIFGSRTAAGHDLMTRAGASFSAWYAQTKQHAAALKREATTPSVPFAADGNTGASATATPAPAGTGSAATPAKDPGTPSQPATPSSAAGTAPRSGDAATRLDQAPGPDAARSNPSYLPAATPPAATRPPLAAGPDTTQAARSTAPATPAPAKAAVLPAPAPPKRTQETASLGYGAAAPAHSTAIEAAPEETRALLRVPMTANLVSSRVPVYPVEARSAGVEGQVMLDVIITSSGLVRAVRLISGDPRLRAAAEESVMKWRYRPYLQNGRPLEVVTTVRVDFRLR